VSREREQESRQYARFGSLPLALGAGKRLIELPLQLGDPLELNLLFLLEHLDPQRQVADLRLQRGLTAVAITLLLTARMETMT
jgi:hypothetical protein